MVLSENVREALFDGFQSAIRRTRWFILVTTLLSTLLFYKIYIERWGFQEQQLAGVYAHRALKSTDSSHVFMQQLNDWVEVYKTAKLDSSTTRSELKGIADEIRNSSYKMFVRERTDNTLKRVSLDNESLPFLGIGIPKNDYVPIAGTMLAIFTIGVWLNVRTIRISIEELFERYPENEDIADIVRVHFTFTGLQDSESRPLGVTRYRSQYRAAQLLESAAYWLPFAILCIATYFDIWPGIQQSVTDSEFYMGPMNAIALRVLVLVACIVTAALAAHSSSSHANSVERLIRNRLQKQLRRKQQEAARIESSGSSSKRKSKKKPSSKKG